MTRQRYSKVESLNRILRLFQGKPVPTDVPNTVSDEVLSENNALSDLAELLAGSLPNETATLPSAISVPAESVSGDLTVDSVSTTTLQVGTYPNIAYFEGDGTLRFTGTASMWDDLRVDGLNTRVGVTAPTDETGFRGNSNFQVRNFVHNQADEVQFDIQFPHGWANGTDISPHVHFSPWITGTQSVQAVKFILDYYWGNVNEDFPTGSSQYSM
jgi:hypothetical protein